MCDDFAWIKPLRAKFDSRGIRLHGAKISGKLDLSFASIASVLGFSHCRFKEEILLRWATLANLSLHGSSAKSIDAQGVTIGGNLDLCHGFRAQDEVCLIGAQISGDLNCNGAQFSAVRGNRMTIEGGLLWRDIRDPKNATLDLLGAGVGSMNDELSWPPVYNLSLDGFTYGRLSEPKDSYSRLDWLGRQFSFKTQPYHQLAKVLREEGDNAGARRVLYEMEKRIHSKSEFWPVLLWNLAFRWTIGYGIYPMRALWWLLMLVALGWGSYGHFSGLIAPTNEEAYNKFHADQLPDNYPRFQPLVYSAENCFPLVKLGQTEFWAPDPSREGPAQFLRCFRWCQILFGWILATFFVAGVTGIARKD